MNDQLNKSRDINIKEMLAGYLGVESEDIEAEDSFTDDLHMRPSDITDFLELMKEKGIDTTMIDLSQIETVQELIDILDEEEYK